MKEDRRRDAWDRDYMGDYYSKPSIDDVFEIVYKIMQEYNPAKYKLKLS